MGWNRIRIRATSTATALAVENLDFNGLRGATKMVICAKAGDANTLSAAVLQRKDAMGPTTGVPPFIAQDGYATINAGLATETGDALIGNNFNNTDSGTQTTGRARVYDFGREGCFWNTFRLRITIGATGITQFTIDAFVYHPSAALDNNVVTD